MEQPEYTGPIVNNSIDTNRWDLVPARAGDIIIATSSKMGTTWTQMLCALLVHGPELPLPLAELSPWLDGGAWDYNEDSVEVFNAQPWRRIMKTHTPLHALKFREDAFYVTCGRDPRDVFLSSLDHGDNSALPGGQPPSAPLDRDKVFAGALDFEAHRNIGGVFDYIASFWRYRALPNIIHLHYNDMSDDLEGEMARLAVFLGIERSPDEILALSRHARFDAMRAEADDLAPGSKVAGRWKSNADFFRKGRRGEWRDIYSPETQALYVSATRTRYDHTMLDWLEGGQRGDGRPEGSLSPAQTLQVTEAEYRQRFRDPDFGLDVAALLAERCRLPRPLVRHVEGSNLVFRAGESLWLKIAPPFWTEAFDAELAVTAAVQGRLPAPVPSIVDSGALDAWRYLVTRTVPGVQIQTVATGLGEADLEHIAAELGQFIRAFQSVVIPGFARAFGPWPRYLDERLAGARALHRSRGVDPVRVGQITAFLDARAPALRALGPPVLIHADLTAEHVMLVEEGGRWRLSGVLDLADAMPAPGELDLIAPLLEAFRGRAGPQRRLMAEAGIRADAGMLMAVALQHRFVQFNDWFAPEIGQGFSEITDIARAAFPV